MPRFLPAAELKRDYGIFGHFYSIVWPDGERQECRSVLEIARWADVQDEIGGPTRFRELTGREADAVVVMMNPGSSRPLVEVDERIEFGDIGQVRESLVPTHPDTTQYQIMRLMHFCGWRHVRVLNLSDLRSPQSPQFIRMFQRLERDRGFDGHSVFSARRQRELRNKLRRRRSAPIIRAWGVSEKLDPLIHRCLARLPAESPVLGLADPAFPHRYRHPLPSLHEQQRQWIDRMLEQWKSLNSSAK